MSVAWNNFCEQLILKGGYKTALQGLLATIEIAVAGLIIGIILGTLIALVKVMPKYKVLPRVASAICDVYVGFFRGTPMVVQLLLGYYVLLPALGIASDAIVVAIITFGLNSGAYVSEIMRAGIQSVDAGQLEAGRAVGLPYWQAMLKIVIPQSIKNILPTLGNEFIALIKETAVVGYVGAVDITYAFQYQGANSYEYMVPYLAMALIYIILVACIAGLVKLMERRLARSERRN